MYIALSSGTSFNPAISKDNFMISSVFTASSPLILETLLVLVSSTHKKSDGDFVEYLMTLTILSLLLLVETKLPSHIGWTFRLLQRTYSEIMWGVPNG
jgi:hypothetical protein